MSVTKEEILDILGRIDLPDGRNLVRNDMVRAMNISEGEVRFVIEVGADEGAQMEPLRAVAERAVGALEGVNKVQVALTAHSAKPAPAAEPPNLKIGGHPKPQDGPIEVAGVKNIIAIASGKGGVGKSTVSSNLAVALAAAGRRVGLLDADIYGPSQPRMMGTSKRPSSPDGKEIIPLTAHGVTLMSIGLMVPAETAIVWRGPMLMGALQQMLGQVRWGELDILIIDLPPGTGDVQLTLAQKTKITGAIVVSTPQDVALLDARKALDMFDKTETPVLGMIENMAHFCCPNCGTESAIFGSGGARKEAETLGLPFLGAIPIELDIRVAGDEGTPIAATKSPSAAPYHEIAAELINRGIA